MSGMSRSGLAALTALAVLAPSAAAAGPSNAPLTVAAQFAPHSDVPDPHSPAVALGLSLGTTAAGYLAYYGMVETQRPELGWPAVAGIALGPSAGHWYVGDLWSRGLGVRMAGAATAAVGVALALDSCPLFEDCEESTASQVVLALGAAAFLAGTVDDIVTAPLEAKQRNAAARKRLELAVAPRVTGKDVGLVVAGRF